jgi:flagellar biosynthesis/type III secretory pathway chaperone
LRSITIAAAITLAFSLGWSGDSKSKALEEQHRDSAERLGLIRDKDNLGAAVAEYAAMVNELDGVLRTSSDLKSREGIVDDRERRRDLLRRARALRHSLDSMSTRIQELETQARKSGAVNESRLADIAALKATVTQLTQMSDRQRVEIERMAVSFDSLSQVSKANESHAANLQTALSENVERQESVFVAVGTSKELSRLGVVRKRGGVMGMGETLVPILPFKPVSFKPLRMSTDTLIELPKPSATYRVITAQNASAVQNGALSRITGKLVIHDPKLFWRDSRFLIIVER